MLNIDDAIYIGHNTNSDEFLYRTNLLNLYNDIGLFTPNEDWIAHDEPLEYNFTSPHSESPIIPVVRLISNIEIVGGNGTISNPYVIS